MHNIIAILLTLSLFIHLVHNSPKDNEGKYNISPDISNHKKQAKKSKTKVEVSELEDMATDYSDFKMLDAYDKLEEPITDPSDENEMKNDELSSPDFMNHLKNIAEVQFKIIKTLKRVEQNIKNSKSCSLHELAQQIKAMADLKDSMNLEFPKVPGKSASSELSKTEIQETGGRIVRSLNNDRLISYLNLRLALVEDKRVKLIQQLDNMHINNQHNTPRGMDLVSPEQKICEVAETKKKEVEKVSRQLKMKVMERRRAVIKLLQAMLREEEEELSNKEIKNNTGPQLGASVGPRVAGIVDIDRCRRCEQLEGEQVCGDNGKTYTTLCHAVNCAGLAMRDIKAKSCIRKDVCLHSKCATDKTCFPLNLGPCLTIYSKDGLRKLPCKQYTCVDKNCDLVKFSQVCGMDSKTYNSLCHLHQAGQQLSYTGVCRPHLCLGEVCGADRNTYKSSCHARTYKIRIDYSGKCTSEELVVPSGLNRCTVIRLSGYCKKGALCRNPVLPVDSCCPICGGAMEISLTIAAICTLVSQREERNHLYYLENMFRELLPLYAVKKCELSTSLTDSGNITLILEAQNPGDHQLCQDALVQMANSIRKNQSFPVHPTFEISSSIFDSLVRDTLINIQDKIIDTPDKVKILVQNELGDKLLDVNEKINDLPLEESPNNAGWVGGNKMTILIQATSIMILTVAIS